MLPLSITEFIQAEHIVSVCVSENNEPYCFLCFYVLIIIEEMPVLIFKSSANSLHSKIILKNYKVAGTILPGKTLKLVTEGVQFLGECYQVNLTNDEPLRNKYYLRFPFALAVSGDLWKIDINEIKYTKNKVMGANNKLFWKREEIAFI